jgi:hypothetical protein
MATVARETAVSAAREAAWDRIGELAERARRDRDGALRALAELFRSGRPPEGIDGTVEGRFVAFAVHPVFDRAVAAGARVWMPWDGKRFDAASGRGVNLLLGGRMAAFDFRSGPDRGVLAPGLGVLVLDYSAARPLPIPWIRDELVEVGPRVYLGQMLWRRRGGHRLAAYFALRT